MLAEIGVAECELGRAVHDPGEPAFQGQAPAQLFVHAHHRNEFFPQLERVLLRRFHRVGEERLQRELLGPFRNALGNAHRRGNGEDLARWLDVEVVVSERGAVVVVTDEGSGFDIERVLRQLANKERYFTRGGHGMRCFIRTSSVVSYADGGRTWLMRFCSDPEPGEPQTEEEGAAFGPAGDPGFMRTFLAGRLACFRDHGVELDSCRVFARPGKLAASELAYVLGCRARGRPARTIVLTARLLPAEAARADVAMAARLRAAGVGSGEGLRIARPLGAFAEPALSLFHLDPSLTLRDVVKRTTRGTLAPILRSIALGLAELHRCTVEPEDEVGLAAVIERHLEAMARVEERLADGRIRERARACFERLLARSGRLARCRTVPVHGALAWDCIVRSRRGWELFRFDECRLAHPCFDLGDFLADLLRFALHPSQDRRLYAAGRAVLLGSYLDGSRPPWARDLDWFVASALLERLERMMRREQEKWEPKVAPLLDEIERALDARA